ncbi:hypothetical protein POX_d06142 [Penicillium oxalicum]|uniref:hypothetical protein n=1 Tax=Penicillium oxalicum TaxID=69781 RepID=UPI0020B6E9F9|nr:hypothetical protein POX_d06142 [Penicillium oxalicum]KAI2790621.1 hypothetical protein POX_d06142 [Penicillium oxalicum]
MSKPLPRKKGTSTRQQQREQRILQNRLYTTLGITDAGVQNTINGLLREIYDAGVVDLRSSVRREMVRLEIRDRMHRMPDAIRNHSDTRDSVVNNLYRIFRSLQSRWQKEEFDSTQDTSTNPATSTQQAAPANAGELFDHSGPSVVPDADVQIIAYDRPTQPLPIRLSDLLANPNDPVNRSRNGDWIDAHALRHDILRRALVNEGFASENSALWWSPHALETLAPTMLASPRDGETRLSSLNIASTIIRTISVFYSAYRASDNPGSCSSTLARPSFTIIVRPQAASGGVLGLHQPGLARPGSEERVEKMVVPSRKTLEPRRVSPSGAGSSTRGFNPGNRGSRDRPRLFFRSPIPDSSLSQAYRRPSTFRSSLFSFGTARKRPPVSYSRPLKSQFDARSFQTGPASHFNVPQSARDALKTPGPGSAQFEYEGLGIVPRDSPPLKTVHARLSPTTQDSVPAVQGPETKQEKRRRSHGDGESSARQSQRPRLSSAVALNQSPAFTGTGLSMNINTIMPPIASGQTEELNSTTTAPAQRSSVNFHPRSPQRSIGRNRALGESNRHLMRRKRPSTLRPLPQSPSSGSFFSQSQPQSEVIGALQPAVEESAQQMPHDTEEVFGEIGDNWLEIPLQRMPPVIQKEIRSRRFSEAISEGTGRLALTGETEPSSKVAAPRVAPPSLQRIELPPTEDDRILARRKRRRLFSEYRVEADRSSSTDSQKSPRKRRRLTSGSPSRSPNPKRTLKTQKKAAKRVKKPPTAAERKMTLEVGRMSAQLERLETQAPRSPSPKGKRLLSNCTTA